MKIRHAGLLLLLCAALLAGCGSKKTVVTDDGTATVTTDPSGDTTATVETDEGTSTMTTTSDGDDSHTTIETPEGTAEATTEGDKATVTSDMNGVKSETQTGGSGLTAEDVGVEFYPGAEEKMSHKSENADGSTTNMVQLSSIDDPDKIMKFYEDQLGGNLTSKTSMDKMRTLIKIDGKIQHSISIMTDNGTSQINIARVDRTSD